jgi:tellurite resistance protein TerC
VSEQPPADAVASTPAVGSPALWTTSIAVLVGLLVLDFVRTRRPHAVSLREGVGWSAFYLALPVVFGAFLWGAYGNEQALEFYTGFVVEKSLSVDNLFVFVMLLAAFAVPAELAQRVMLFGIVGALVLRGVLIALGAVLLQAGTWAFLVFGAVLFMTAARILREELGGATRGRDVSNMRSVRLLRLLRLLMPVTDEYRGTRLWVRAYGRCALTVDCRGCRRGPVPRVRDDRFCAPRPAGRPAVHSPILRMGGGRSG